MVRDATLADHLSVAEFEDDDFLEMNGLAGRRQDAATARLFA
jgi:hypothetical protein